MEPGKHDMTAYRGGTFNVGIAAKDPDGVQYNFSEYTEIRMEVRESWAYALGSTKPDPIITLSTLTGSIIIDDDNLGFTLHISAEDTETLTFDKAVYVIELVTVPAAAGETLVDKLLYGFLYVKGEDTV